MLSRPSSRRPRLVLLAATAAVLAGACGAPVPPVPPAAKRQDLPPPPPPDAKGPVPDGATMRDLRYCEILIAERSGLRIAVDVYSTAGVDECPLDRWRALEPKQLADQLDATAVLLKGPRYWTVDRLDGMPKLIDPVVRELGGIRARKAARVEFGVFDASEMSKPYRINTIAADAAWVYDAQRRVDELVAPDGTAFVMLAYSTQKAKDLTAATLASLPARLKGLPDKWTLRSRTLAEPLRVPAVDGAMLVVQDELDNVYVAKPK